MRLTVYGSMPTTPVVTGPIAKRASDTWRSVSRASTRVSLGARKRSILKMGNPQIHSIDTDRDRPLRRSSSFKPIQLSICGEKKLPDLPEFDTVSFDEIGTIREPPKALLRSVSDESLQDPVSDSTSLNIDNLCLLGSSTTLQHASDLDYSRHYIDASAKTDLRAPSSITNPAYKRATVTVSHKQQLSQSALIVLASSAVSSRMQGEPTPAWSDEPVPTLQLQPAPDSSLTRVRSWLDSDCLTSRKSSVNTIEIIDDPSTTSSFIDHRQRVLQSYQLKGKPRVDTAVSSLADAERSTPLSPKRPSPIKIYKIFPIGIAIRSAPDAAMGKHTQTASSTPSTIYSSKPTPHIESQVLPQASRHGRTATASTTSTAATDSSFKHDESSEEVKSYYSVAGANVETASDSDTNSTSTYNDSAFNSRSSTLRSIHSTTFNNSRAHPRQRQDCNVSDVPNPYGDYYDDEPTSINYAASSPGLCLFDSLNKETLSPFHTTLRPQSFHFTHVTTKDAAAAATTMITPLGSPWRQAEAVEQYMHEMCASAGLRRVNVGVAF